MIVFKSEIVRRQTQINADKAKGRKTNVELFTRVMPLKIHPRLSALICGRIAFHLRPQE